MGGALVLMAVGLIQPDERPGIGARIVAFLFGAVLVSLGFRGLVAPLAALARANGASDWLSALRMGGRRLVRRTDLPSLAAAAALAPLVLGYWTEGRGGRAWGLSRETLMGLVPIEFLLIHGFPFLAIAASFARLPDRAPRWVGRAAVMAFLLLYSSFAWGVFDGPSGVLVLLYLSLPNVLAFAGGRHDWTVRTTAVARWVIKFIPFFGLAMLLNQTSFDDPGVLPLGLYYFGMQTLVELFRVAELPLDLAAAWERLPTERRTALPLGTPDQT